MFGVFVSDVLFNGPIESVGILLSGGVIFGSLIAKLVANHEVIMRSTAPGAQLYQRLVIASHTFALRNVAHRTNYIDHVP